MEKCEVLFLNKSYGGVLFCGSVISSQFFSAAFPIEKGRSDYRDNLNIRKFKLTNFAILSMSSIFYPLSWCSSYYHLEEYFPFWGLWKDKCRICFKYHQSINQSILYFVMQVIDICSYNNNEFTTTAASLFFVSVFVFSVCVLWQHHFFL